MQFSVARLRWAAVLLAVVLFAGAAGAQQLQRTPFWSPGRNGEEPRLTYTADGYLRSAGAVSGTAFRATGGSSEEIARAFLSGQARWFFDGSSSVAFATKGIDSAGGRDYVHFTQTVRGLPVFGANATVQVNGGGVQFVLSDIMRNLSGVDLGRLSTTPYVNSQQAKILAERWAAAQPNGAGAVASEPTLQIYDPQVIGNEGPAELVWVLEAGVPDVLFRHAVLVNAASGKISLHYSLIEEALNRKIYDAVNTNTQGTLRRSEGGGPYVVSQVNEAYDYLGDTYNFYLANHGRDSINDAGLILDATVRYCEPGDCPMANAFWDGSRMWFGDGFQKDDIAGHELTHGVTQYESGLIYVNESGAINESFSDMWGEWIDQGNGAGNDTVGAKWLMGEDIGAIRDMADPPSFGDPDRMGSPNFYTGASDNGGVHTNSGVGNKLCYLLTDGDTFNGYTITGFGIATAADLMYEVQSNLLGASSDYGDLYDALTQAAINLGMDSTQKNNVEMACRAVEIKFLPPVTDFAAETQDSVAQIDLSWTNPVSPTFANVVVRRSTSSYPATPTSGTLVYQGTGTSYSDTGVVIGVGYYYSIWANHGSEGYSPVSNASATAGVEIHHPAEEFTGTVGDSTDLSFLTITYTPLGSTGYTNSAVSAFTWPVALDSQTLLTLPDDGYVQITLSGGKTVPLYGVNWSNFFVNSNGRVTFGSGSGDYDESLADHFGIASVAALFHDLNPTSGGNVRGVQLADRAVITFDNVPDYWTLEPNSFQYEFFFNGTIRVTYLQMGSTAGIAGVSPGTGIPFGFAETDLSEGAVALPVPMRAGAIALSAIVIGWLGMAAMLRRRRAD